MSVGQTKAFEIAEANRRVTPDWTRTGESKSLGRRGWDKSSGVRGTRRVAFALLSAEGQNRIPQRGRIVAPLPAAVVFELANGPRGMMCAGACAVVVFMPAGA